MYVYTHIHLALIHVFHSPQYPSPPPLNTHIHPGKNIVISFKYSFLSFLMDIEVNTDFLIFLLYVKDSLLLYISCICFVHSTKYPGEFFISGHGELPMLVQQLHSHLLCGYTVFNSTGLLLISGHRVLFCLFRRPVAQHPVTLVWPREYSIT